MNLKGMENKMEFKDYLEEVKENKSKENTIAFKILKEIERRNGMTWGQIQDFVFELKGESREPRKTGSYINKSLRKPESSNTNLQTLMYLYMKKEGNKWIIDSEKLPEGVDSLRNKKIYTLNNSERIQKTSKFFRRTRL